MHQDKQNPALTHGEGPMLCIAGPGSGKTYTLTHRIRYLISERHVEASEILVITFTKSAALEMQQRFYDLMPDRPPVVFGTFHSVFFTILSDSCHYSAANVLKEKDRLRLIEEVLDRNRSQSSVTAAVASEISLVTNCMHRCEDYSPKSLPPSAFWSAYDGYRRKKQSLHMVDFDDMLLLTYELLSSDPALLASWQGRFSYFLIDEFQDVNPLQYETLKLMASSKNIFAVGDDDQSIYSFRGADPSIMKKFPADYPDCKLVRLENNYRSGAAIVEKASRLISHNHNRFDKAYRPAADTVARISHKEFEDSHEEADHIIAILRKEKARISEPDADSRPSSSAILFRNHRQAAYLISQLKKYEIPYFTSQHLEALTDHFICKDIKSYLSIAAGVGDEGDFLRILNRPNRYISRACVSADLHGQADAGGSKVELIFNNMCSWYSENTGARRAIEKWYYASVRMAKLRPLPAIDYIRRALGYDNFLNEYSEANDVPLTEYLEILEEISDIARKHANIKDFLKELDMMEARGSMPLKTEEPMVSLYTYHAAKGLEFRRVFMLDCNEAITPSEKARTDTELEEERRMFYVAITRAKEELHLYYCRRRRNRKLNVSRFLKEMNE